MTKRTKVAKGTAADGLTWVYDGGDSAEAHRSDCAAIRPGVSPRGYRVAFTDASTKLELLSRGFSVRVCGCAR